MIRQEGVVYNGALLNMNGSSEPGARDIVLV